MRPSHYDCAFVFLLTKWYCGEVDRTFGQHRETSAEESHPHVITRATVHDGQTMRFMKSSAILPTIIPTYFVRKTYM